MVEESVDVVIIGGGLSGLTCARYLADQRISCIVLEASDRVGGRIKTDNVDGFLLDRGFQVMLTAYPEAEALLDYGTLSFSRFHTGGLVHLEEASYKISDPYRFSGRSRLKGTLKEGIRNLTAPIGSASDKLKVATLRKRLVEKSLDEIYGTPEMTTLAYLRNEGFSEDMIDRFFRPFLGGIFLENDLMTSSRMFEFVFKMFSAGDAVLPAEGMEAIPRQLAEGLPEGTVWLNAPVKSLGEKSVLLEDGTTLHAKAVVVATDLHVAAKLLPELTAMPSRGVSCLYFAANTPPIEEPILVLNGSGRGLINNLCVPSNIAPSYAPPGKSLISVTVLGAVDDEEHLLPSVTAELRDWYGPQVNSWTHLKTYRIQRALPYMIGGSAYLQPMSVALSPERFLCGDYRDTPSINGAMASGRRVAEAISVQMNAALCSSVK